MLLKTHPDIHIQIYNLKNPFDRPHNMGEVFVDYTHVNHIGNKKIAEEVVKIMRENPEAGILKRDGSEISVQNETDELMEKRLAEFIDEIAKYKTESKNAGAVVMNCNPFTYGHRHLIEYAAIQTDKLFIFVVEEDKSYFKFEDRFALVKCGTADLPNVTVLPSGKFIISSVTFEEYFDKDALQGAEINPALNIKIFARYIAPALNIKKRFAGEEPNCYITNQYNHTMRKILPKHGVEFIEIPRKESGGKPISASEVRELVKKKDTERIKEIVPEITFKFIIEKIMQSAEIL